MMRGENGHVLLVLGTGLLLEEENADEAHTQCSPVVIVCFSLFFVQQHIEHGSGMVAT